VGRSKCSCSQETDVSGEPIGPFFKLVEDGTDGLPRNVGKEFTLAAQFSKIMQFSVFLLPQHSNLKSSFIG
jgi:hypothetical protein